MSTFSYHDNLDDLLVRAAGGDTAAFAALYADTAPRAFGLALRVVHDRAHAEDVTQEAYLKIWHTAARFDARRGSCQTWIFMIVHRVAVDQVRSIQARTARDDRQPRQAIRENRVDADPTHDLVHASLEATLARDALARLSRPQRRALELAYFDGHTHTEVATLLDLPLGTAKSQIRDGLIRLRSSMLGADGLPAST